jgi:heme exporter protein D
MSDFFYMGGYGAYIWSAMGAAAFFMLLEPILLMMGRRSVLQEVKRVKRLEERQNRKTRKLN